MGTLPDVGDAKRDGERAGDLLILVTKKAKLEFCLNLVLHLWKTVRISVTDSATVMTEERR